MNKFGKNTVKYTLLLILFITGIYAVYIGISGINVSMKQFIDVCNAENGKSIVSWYEKNKIVVARIDQEGKIEKSISFDCIQDEKIYSVTGIGAGSDDMVYVLRNSSDCYTGEVKDQELMVIDLSGIIGDVKKVISLSTEGESYQYGWINVSGSTISLIATDPYETSAIRRTYEYGSLLSGALTVKNTRTYPLLEEEGIFQAIGNSEDLVYISDSGKVFKADEEKVTEVYPARTVETLMYPTFISYAESGYIFLGEHESGNILKLNLETGDEEVVFNGNSTFNGSSLYTPKNILNMSMSNISTFTAVVQNTQSESLNILSTKDGETTTIVKISYSIVSILIKFLMTWLFAAGTLLTAYGVIQLFVSGIRNGHTIMGRLLFATIPLIFAAMALFGVVAFSYYKSSIQENFKKQTIDEGNMLTALFGQESFNDIEYPYDYTGDAYRYLKNQLATRELYSRVVYYENNELYIGVDEKSPCFYPFGIFMNLDAKDLYLKAALTGEAVTGTIKDNLGERLVCITPVGGLSGQTVYLLETGIYKSNIDRYVNSYLNNFAMVCVVFLIITLIVLGILYYRILLPLGDMKWVMTQFSEGNRDIRLEITSEDELAGISRIFNNMADDIMVRIHNLEKMGETYYRFVPLNIINFLGMNNLEELSLGNKVEGNYAVLGVELSFPDEVMPEKTEALTNRFFTTVNNYAMQNQLVPIMDSANLNKMILICQKGVDLAIVTALSILAKLDSENSLVEEDEKIAFSFVLDKVDLSFGICGDKDRYALTLFAPEFEEILQHKEFFTGTGSRILITDSAYEGIANTDAYANRYIGKITLQNREASIYDIFDDKTAEEIKLMKQTMRAFDKAMELYEKGIYYEAKNLFAMVLRENSQDKIAKRYVFCCEELQNKK